jgi:two-component system phosphate regulon response regulator PhoB
MEHSQIVIVEDEVEISELIQSNLVPLGYKTKQIVDGKKALEFIQSEESKNVDLYILDRMLPSMSGIEILKFLRMYNLTKHTPILMLTALSTPEQIVEGLDAGADDYMTKPFDLNVLNARVKSLLRRQKELKDAPNEKNVFRLKELKVDMDQCKVWISNELVELTLSEFKLLCCFLQSPGKVLTRNQLVEFIQDGPVHVTDRTIDTHIFGLRKKLGDYANFIETIRGVGYRVVNND